MAIKKTSAVNKNGGVKMYGYNLDKYFSKVQEITKESDSVLHNFFKTISTRLDKNIEEVNKDNLDECIKYAGRYQLGRFLVLMNVVG